LVTSAFILVLVLITQNNFVFKVVPHITNAIQEWIERVAMIPVDGKEGPADVCVIELGGTIGGHEMSFFCLLDSCLH
jgi:CTP synthase (UTP-ammonia lyase)